MPPDIAFSISLLEDIEAGTEVVAVRALPPWNKPGRR